LLITLILNQMILIAKKTENYLKKILEKPLSMIAGERYSLIYKISIRCLWVKLMAKILLRSVNNHQSWRENLSEHK
jgi:hypothetical protein